MAYMSDKEQALLLKDWWNKYGVPIVLGIAIFMVINIGWRYWQQHQQQYNEQSSILFSQMVNAQMQHKAQETELFAKNLMQNYKNSSYASFSAFLLAKQNIEQNKLTEATNNLQWIVDNAKKEHFIVLAKIRLARILIEDKKYLEARNLLAQDSSKLFTAEKYEIIADSFMQENKSEEAKKYYQQAIDAVKNNQGKYPDLFPQAISPLLQIKAEQFGIKTN